MLNTGEKMIAFCGLYCTECFNYKGEIADLARDLRKKLREERFDKVSRGLSKYFKPLAQYDICYEVLGGMVRLRCKRACRDGGGNPGCKIRICCQKKDILGCWECSEFEACGRLAFLAPIHGEEHLVNLRNIKKYGTRKFISARKS
jgi:hypothetical protein